MLAIIEFARLYKSDRYYNIHVSAFVLLFNPESTQCFIHLALGLLE